MGKIFKYLFLFIIGGGVYIIIELLYRGYSHWSMFLLGGECFILCGLLNEIFTWEMPIWLQQFVCACIITGFEFVTGLIVNVYLKLNVWDYSNMKFNVLGQICLPFFIVWFFVSLVAIVLDDWLRYIFFKEEEPRYTFKLNMHARKKVSVRK